jgi:hypothetical protein
VTQPNGGTRIPNWMMPALTAAALGAAGWTYAQVWAISNQVLTNKLMIEQHTRDIELLRRDHDSIIDIGSDLRVIKDHLASVEGHLLAVTDLLARERLGAK